MIKLSLLIQISNESFTFDDMSKKIRLLVTIITINVQLAFSQVYINQGVDTTDTNIKESVKFYSTYLLAFKGRTLPDFKKYWSEEDCLKYKVPDPSVYSIAWNYPTYSMGTNKTVFYAKPMKNGIINLKVMGGELDSTKKFELTYIASQYISKKQDGTLKLIRPIDALKDSWKNKKVGEITYHYPNYHRFDKRKANNLIAQINDLRKEWNLKPIAIDYFFANSYEEIQVLRGFDFTIGMGNQDKPMGISNLDDNAIYCAGNGENYFHEVIHIYLNPLHPNSPLNEGLASFYGGSLGKPISWHIPRLKEYLNKNPKINLNKLEDFYYMDNFTNPTSAIQGMICKIVVEKDGIVGLKRLMSYTSMTDIFEKELKLNVKNLNNELRALINKQID